MTYTPLTIFPELHCLVLVCIYSPTVVRSMLSRRSARATMSSTSFLELRASWKWAPRRVRDRYSPATPPMIIEVGRDG